MYAIPECFWTILELDRQQQISNQQNRLHTTQHSWVVRGDASCKRTEYERRQMMKKKTGKWRQENEDWKDSLQYHDSNSLRFAEW